MREDYLIENASCFWYDRPLVTPKPMGFTMIPPKQVIGWLSASILICWPFATFGQNAATNVSDTIVLTTEGRVETLRFGGADWRTAVVNERLRFKDQLRTGFKSRATARLSDQSVLRLNQLTTIQIQPPSEQRKRLLELRVGEVYFFNRDQPGETGFQTPQASGAIRGTEFDLLVDDAGKTVVTMIDGEVGLTNALGSVQLRSGEQGIAEPGQPPRKTAVLDAVNIIQWALYYPGIVDFDELNLAAGEQSDLQGSIAAYRAGDLLRAIDQYPTNRTGISTAERLYAATVSLAAGQVAASESLLAELNVLDPNSNSSRIAAALRQLIAAVKYQPRSRSMPPQLASEWMAQSYYDQSQSRLEAALEAARKATVKSPNFGFAWERVAELEFSFGRVDKALQALDKSIQLSPRNAQALALRGFLLAAQNHLDAAEKSFEEAIAADGALGNAWLGRGLVRIKKGHRKVGREDLQTAAGLEPNRAILRSYLGKAYSNEGDLGRAEKEIALARKIDPNDPTSWLYSALLNQQRNRLNEAVEELEKSKELNDNRRLFRSKMLLDQDRAVRSANLASIYRDEGLFNYSVREASRAVNSDYANYSAHLFLAESYDALRDPRQINLRYESPWLNELLLANLLAPVGAGSLSQNISQQEYSKLFESDGLGVSSRTEYLSRGAWIEDGSQYGTFGNSAYALDVNYRRDPGERRPNDDIDSLTWYAKFKQQLTPDDSLFLETVYYNFESGDVVQYFDQSVANPLRRIKERQEPLIFAGYHHQWSPGSHTLFLAGRLNDTFELKDPIAGPLFVKKAGGAIFDLENLPLFSLDFRSKLEGLTTELEHILELPNQTWVAGGRYQAAWNSTQSHFTTPADVPGAAPAFPGQDIDTDIRRGSIYVYDIWQIFDPLRLTFGLSYDHLRFPRNIDTSPITAEEKTKDQVSPKAGLIWTPWTNTWVRADFTRSLGGVFFDNSVRLEPSQIAGFNQTFRSLLPESSAGLVPGTKFETWGAALEHQFRTGTYVSLEAQRLGSKGDRLIGAFTNSKFIVPVPDTEISVDQFLDYQEKSVLLDINQLLAKEWSVGASYRLTHASLDSRSGVIPSAVPGAFVLNQNVRADLHQVYLYTIFNHPSGFFSQFITTWDAQSNRRYTPDLPGDDFWQFHIFFGYRFPRRLAEVRLGVLNLTDRDYRLNPLTLYQELPRERTFTASVKFNF